MNRAARRSGAKADSPAAIDVDALVEDLTIGQIEDMEAALGLPLEQWEKAKPMQLGAVVIRAVQGLDPAGWREVKVRDVLNLMGEAPAPGAESSPPEG